MMLLLLLTTAAASAAEPGILQVPEGSVLTVPGGKPQTVATYSFLLPESYYDQALIQAKQLQVCQPALDKCTAMAGGWVDVAHKSLEACSGQFDTDEATIETLRTDVTALETRAQVAESRLQSVRGQRNVAWAIAGGMILGATTITAVAVGI